MTKYVVLKGELLPLYNRWKPKRYKEKDEKPPILGKCAVCNGPVRSVDAILMGDEKALTHRHVKICYYYRKSR